MIDISVVIVNYNVKQLILQCLRTLYKFNTTLNLEVFVVDNHSTDESVVAIKKEFPQVILIENKFNAGFPTANNQAFNLASRKFIFMLNPDTEFLNNDLFTSISYLNTHKEYDLLGPKLLNTDGSYQISAWKFPKIWYVIVNTLYIYKFYTPNVYSKHELSQPKEVDSVSGAAILFRREILQKLQGLDEHLFWIEDIDFCYRAKLNGHKAVFFPQTTIIHHSGKSAITNYKISVSNKVFNIIKYYKKHHSKPATNLIIAISFFNALSKLIIFTILSPFNSVYRKKAKAYLYTISKIHHPPLTT